MYPRPGRSLERAIVQPYESPVGRYQTLTNLQHRSSLARPLKTTGYSIGAQSARQTFPSSSSVTCAQHPARSSRLRSRTARSAPARTGTQPGHFGTAGACMRADEQPAAWVCSSCGSTVGSGLGSAALVGRLRARVSPAGAGLSLARAGPNRGRSLLPSYSPLSRTQSCRSPAHSVDVGQG
jgi:hypothetical protein